MALDNQDKYLHYYNKYINLVNQQNLESTNTDYIKRSTDVIKKKDMITSLPINTAQMTQNIEILKNSTKEMKEMLNDARKARKEKEFALTIFQYMENCPISKLYDSL